MTSAASSRLSGDPNVTPMLDVLLVLLIIFLAASIRVRHTFDAQLPVPCTGACGTDAPIVLEVLPGPEYRINQAPVPRGALAQTLAGIFGARPDKKIQVASPGGVTYQQVVSAIDVARGSGATVVGIVPKSVAAGTPSRR